MSVERLGALFAAAPTVPLQRQVAYELAQHWIDVSAFSQRIAAGDSLLDSTTVRDAMWIQIRRQLIVDFKDAMFGDAFQVPDAEVDSAYRVGEVRFLAHVLRRVAPDATAEERERQRRSADAIRDRLISGGSWEEANAQSDDEGARQAGGTIGPVKRGEAQPRFENAAFSLGPGELSPVTETRAGFHIIYRPELADVRDAFAAALAQDRAASADSVYSAELLELGDVRVRGGATRAIRDVIALPWRSLESTRVLSTFDGGQYTTAQFARVLPYFSDATIQQLLVIETAGIEEFTRQLVLQELLWNRVDSAGIQLSDSVYALLAEQHRTEIATLRNAYGVTAESLLEENGPATNEPNAAAARVDAYFDAAASGEIELQPLPPPLALLLRGDIEWSVSYPGIDLALDLAARLRASEQDSAAQAPALELPIR